MNWTKIIGFDPNYVGKYFYKTLSRNINGVEGSITDSCSNYRSRWPTVKYLFENPPPEYFPMLGVGSALFVLTSVLLLVDVKVKHSKYLRNGHFKLSSRVIMILTCYWLFALTGFLGMVFLRGDIFLHFVANTYESACILAFFDIIIIHRRTIAEPFANGQVDISMRAPPVCCCLICLPTFKNTKKNFRRSRYAIYQLIFFQSGVEFIRVLTTFDCQYDANSTRSHSYDSLVLISFLVAMWALSILVKSQKVKLAKFRYAQKFGGFKLMILVTKTLYKVLVYLAQNNYINEYGELGAEARVLIWQNFITVVFATLLLACCKNLYSLDDYNMVIHLKKHSIINTVEENDEPSHNEIRGNTIENEQKDEDEKNDDWNDDGDTEEDDEEKEDGDEKQVAMKDNLKEQENQEEAEENKEETEIAMREKEEEIDAEIKEEMKEGIEKVIIEEENKGKQENAKKEKEEDEEREEQKELELAMKDEENRNVMDEMEQVKPKGGEEVTMTKEEDNKTEDGIEEEEPEDEEDVTIKKEEDKEDDELEEVEVEETEKQEEATISEVRGKKEEEEEKEEETEKNEVPIMKEKNDKKYEAEEKETNESQEKRKEAKIEDGNETDEEKEKEEKTEVAMMEEEDEENEDEGEEE